VPPPIGPCFGPAERAEVAAQALKGRRAGPALGTINRASDRARAVLFRVVPRATDRARPIWKSTVWCFSKYVDQGLYRQDFPCHHTERQNMAL
jgi:hypothetical protein